MKHLFRSRRRKMTALVSLLALVAAVGAFAYYTGSGDGTNPNAAQAGTAPVAVTVSVGTVPDALYPGDTGNFDVTVSVPEGSAHISNVLLQAAPGGGCDSEWFSLAAPGFSGGDVTASTPLVIPATIEFENLPISQDGCSDDAISITATVS